MLINFLNACFSYFAFKSTHFAQVLQNFAQTCACTSATFRSSGVSIIGTLLMVQFVHLEPRIFHSPFPTLVWHPRHSPHTCWVPRGLSGLQGTPPPVGDSSVCVWQELKCVFVSLGILKCLSVGCVLNRRNRYIYCQQTILLSLLQGDSFNNSL